MRAPLNGKENRAAHTAVAEWKRSAWYLEGSFPCRPRRGSRGMRPTVSFEQPGIDAPDGMARNAIASTTATTSPSRSHLGSKMLSPSAQSVVGSLLTCRGSRSRTGRGGRRECADDMVWRDPSTRARAPTIAAATARDRSQTGSCPFTRLARKGPVTRLRRSVPRTSWRLAPA